MVFLDPPVPSSMIFVFVSTLCTEDPTSIFSLNEVLGKGTFAAVYHALDRATRLPVAIKRVFLDKTHGTIQSFVVRLHRRVYLP